MTDDKDGVITTLVQKSLSNFVDVGRSHPICVYACRRCVGVLSVAENIGLRGNRLHDNGVGARRSNACRICGSTVGANWTVRRRHVAGMTVVSCASSSERAAMQSSWFVTPLTVCHLSVGMVNGFSRNFWNGHAPSYVEQPII